MIRSYALINGNVMYNLVQLAYWTIVIDLSRGIEVANMHSPSILGFFYMILNSIGYIRFVFFPQIFCLILALYGRFYIMQSRPTPVEFFYHAGWTTFQFFMMEKKYNTFCV